MNQFIRSLILIISMMLLSSSLYSQYQFSAAIGVNNEGLRGAYGNHLRLYYHFNDNLKINSEFARYFQVEDENQVEAYNYDLRSIDVNINYGFMIGDRLSIYGILGFDYTFGRKVTRNAVDTTEQFIETTGLNGGFGAFYKIGRFTPYVELRNIASSSSYLIYSMGLSFSLGRRQGNN